MYIVGYVVDNLLYSVGDVVDNNDGDGGSRIDTQKTCSGTDDDNSDDDNDDHDHDDDNDDDGVDKGRAGGRLKVYEGARGDGRGIVQAGQEEAAAKGKRRPGEVTIIITIIITITITNIITITITNIITIIITNHHQHHQREREERPENGHSNSFIVWTPLDKI